MAVRRRLVDRELLIDVLHVQEGGALGHQVLDHGQMTLSSHGRLGCRRKLRVGSWRWLASRRCGLAFWQLPAVPLLFTPTPPGTPLGNWLVLLCAGPCSWLHPYP